MTQAQDRPVLRRGAAGEAVRQAQRGLVVAQALASSGIDGDFGAATERAVRRFQEARGLPADGIVGPQTWARLPEAPALPVLRRGSAGEAVRKLQTALKEISGETDVPSPGTIDGSFGPRTETSVRSFQRRVDVPVDGVVGDQTWYAPVGGAGLLLDFAGFGD